MSMQDLFQPRVIGELIVSHVLEYAPEPTPDYEAMRRQVLQTSNPNKPVQGFKVGKGS